MSPPTERGSTAAVGAGWSGGLRVSQDTGRGFLTQPHSGRGHHRTTCLHSQHRENQNGVFSIGVNAPQCAGYKRGKFLCIKRSGNGLSRGAPPPPAPTDATGQSWDLQCHLCHVAKMALLTLMLQSLRLLIQVVPGQPSGSASSQQNEVRNVTWELREQIVLRCSLRNQR